MAAAGSICNFSLKTGHAVAAPALSQFDHSLFSSQMAERKVLIDLTMNTGIKEIKIEEGERLRTQWAVLGFAVRIWVCSFSYDVFVGIDVARGGCLFIGTHKSPLPERVNDMAESRREGLLCSICLQRICKTPM